MFDNTTSSETKLKNKHVNNSYSNVDQGIHSLNPFAKEFGGNDHIQQMDQSNNFKLKNDITKTNTLNNNNNETEKSNVNDLTIEQRNELFEEPLNTENAMVAVMGYNPQDDKRICKFYNSLTNSCFKGASCRMEHVEKLAGMYKIFFFIKYFCFELKFRFI